MTVKFINAVNVQLTGVGGVAGPVPHSQWLDYEPYQLANKIHLVRLGQTEM